MTPEAEVYRRAMRATVIALVALAAVAAGVGWWVAGSAGLIAGVAGAAVAALGAIPTQVAMLVSHRQSPQAMAGIVLFSWLGKMVLVVIALVVLAGIEGFHRPMFGITVVVGLMLSLGIDMLSLRRSRVPYVDPGT